MCFFFNDTATTEIYTLSLHDALPISLEIGTSFTGNDSEIYDCEICCNPNKLDYEVYDGEININHVGDGNE